MAQPPRDEKLGLLDGKGRIREENKEPTTELLDRSMTYLKGVHKLAVPTSPTCRVPAGDETALARLRWAC